MQWKFDLLDYEATLERVSELMHAERDTLEGDELEVLTLLVEAEWPPTYEPITPTSLLLSWVSLFHLQLIVGANCNGLSSC